MTKKVVLSRKEALRRMKDGEDRAFAGRSLARTFKIDTDVSYLQWFVINTGKKYEADYRGKQEHQTVRYGALGHIGKWLMAPIRAWYRSSFGGG